MCFYNIIPRLHDESGSTSARRARARSLSQIHRVNGVLRNHCVSSKRVRTADRLFSGNSSALRCTTARWFGRSAHSGGRNRQPQRRDLLRRSTAADQLLTACFTCCGSDWSLAGPHCCWPVQSSSSRAETSDFLRFHLDDTAYLVSRLQDSIDFNSIYMQLLSYTCRFTWNGTAVSLCLRLLLRTGPVSRNQR